MSNPIVFVSYSHDTVAHKEWVYAFSSDLVLNGVDVILDQWDLRAGRDVVRFMHASIARADRVLMICSSKYVSKADTGEGGVGYEKLIVSSDLAEKTDTDKYIPVVRGNTAKQKIPIFMGSRLYLDFESDKEYSNSLRHCLRELHGLPQREKPKLGAFAVPELINSREGDIDAVNERPALTPREIEALRWTMDGKTIWEVGAILGITERTAALHLNNAIHKLGANNKHQAVLKAIRAGVMF